MLAGRGGGVKREGAGTRSPEAPIVFACPLIAVASSSRLLFPTPGPNHPFCKCNRQDRLNSQSYKSWVSAYELQKHDHEYCRDYRKAV
jgi:hypothetical protein